MFGLRPGPTAAITRTITITTQRECIVLVELLHAEFPYAHSTNGMRSLGVVIVLVIAAVGPGRKPNIYPTIMVYIYEMIPILQMAHGMTWTVATDGTSSARRITTLSDQSLTHPPLQPAATARTIQSSFWTDATSTLGLIHRRGYHGRMLEMNVRRHQELSWLRFTHNKCKVCFDSL